MLAPQYFASCSTASTSPSRFIYFLIMQDKDLNFWRKFVSEFFSPSGILRMGLWSITQRQVRTFGTPFS